MTASKVISPWVERYSSLIPAHGHVLDVACGSGRHTRFLHAKGFQLTAVDIDLAAMREMRLGDVNLRQTDLEADEWPFSPNLFDGIVVVNYLWRPLFPKLLAAIKDGGVLIFDTFCIGNEKYGRPRNPDFLLRTEELKLAFSELECLDYFEGFVENPGPAIRQSIVARKRA